MDDSIFRKFAKGKAVGTGRENVGGEKAKGGGGGAAGGEGGGGGGETWVSFPPEAKRASPDDLKTLIGRADVQGPITIFIDAIPPGAVSNLLPSADLCGASVAPDSISIRQLEEIRLVPNAGQHTFIVNDYPHRIPAIKRLLRRINPKYTITRESRTAISAQPPRPKPQIPTASPAPATSPVPKENVAKEVAKDVGGAKGDAVANEVAEKRWSFVKKLASGAPVSGGGKRPKGVESVAGAAPLNPGTRRPKSEPKPVIRIVPTPIGDDMTLRRPVIDTKRRK